ncbi:substrate-binding periplasmic protein [Chromobacterium alticapitis]|uniref:Solute-binding protein family 3/N-terminal domain-containing protein n=1 Tax=Chromobacterium alticapitis TaxID=2073169 RepID=A0A2S5DAA8_9NEIS|nr:transporter substrate-binding domain-containing protein [Chromobacterium alticapitis]POZ60030.1 hypothetical protein C2I19_21125 [Chromobacterium alticapitis]
MKKWFWLALACLLSTPSWAAPERMVINLYGLDYPPFVMKVDGGERGIALEAVDKVLARAGMRGQLVMLPWKRAQLQAQGEEYACLLPLTRSPKREALYRWIGLLDNSDQTLFVLAGKPSRIHSLEDLKGKRVVALLGSSMSDWLRMHQVEFAELPTTEDAYRELSLGVADAWAVHAPVARYLVKQQGRNAVPIQPALRLQETHLYLACSKRMPEAVAQRLSEAFKQVRESGELERITARYLE